MDGGAGPTPIKDAGKGALVVLFLVTMIDMIGFGIVIPFLTYLVEDLAVDQNIAAVGLWVGLLMTSYSAAQFLFSPVWGGLSDRIGRRPVLMIGLVGNTVFFTMFGLANTLLMALAARFLAGVFNGNIAVARLHWRCEHAETTCDQNGSYRCCIWPWIYNRTVPWRRVVLSC